MVIGGSCVTPDAGQVWESLLLLPLLLLLASALTAERSN